MRRLALALAALALCGCAQEAAPPAAAPPSYELGPVLATQLARLEAEVAAQAPAGELEELDPERIPGLAHLLASARGRERELPLEEVRGIGDAAVPTLAALALDAEAAAEERSAACELLAAVGTHDAAWRLCEVLETAAEPWLRAQAAWRLGEVGRDEVLPRLLLRLNYETDPQVRIWVASALAAYRNYAGLEPLWRIESTGASEELRAAAAERRWAVAREAGFEDANEHYARWYEGDPEGRLPQPEPSAHLRLELWRKVSELSGAHFQLRGVDDARIVLSSLGSWATALLEQALHDEDVYVRVHVAQCIERMGPRGSAAGPALLAALDEPALAPQAAAALAGIGYAPAEQVLRARLGPEHSFELRVACAKALGRMALEASLPALRALALSDEPPDLRLAAATGLVQLGAGAEVAPFLLAWMRDPDADRFGAELALESWLRSRDDEAGRALLERWLERSPAAGRIPTPAEDAERLSARAALLDEEIAALTAAAG